MTSVTTMTLVLFALARTIPIEFVVDYGPLIVTSAHGVTLTVTALDGTQTELPMQWAGNVDPKIKRWVTVISLRDAGWKVWTGRGNSLYISGINGSPVSSVTVRSPDGIPTVRWVPVLLRRSPAVDFRQIVGKPAAKTLTMIVEVDGSNARGEFPMVCGSDCSGVEQAEFFAAGLKQAGGWKYRLDAENGTLEIVGWTDPETKKFHAVKKVRFQSRGVGKGCMPAVTMP